MQNPDQKPAPENDEKKDPENNPGHSSSSPAQALRQFGTFAIMIHTPEANPPKNKKTKDKRCEFM